MKKRRRWIAAWLGILMILSCASAGQSEYDDFIYRHGDRNEKRIAITVDDCYEIDKVVQIVELCEKYQIKMTFFPIGNALKYADAPVWQRIVNNGYELGNHSWGHVDLAELDERKNRFQMLRTQQKIDELLGYHYAMHVMRPPFGSSNTRMVKAVTSVGYIAVAKWDVDTTNAKKAFNATENGSILLFHARKADVRCLEKLIPQLLEEGYELVTVSELLNLPPVATSTDIYSYDASHAKDPSLIFPDNE